MIFCETTIKGAFLIKLNEIRDNRGFFARTWCSHEFEQHGLVSTFVQSNMQQSKSKGTLRGMHMQVAPKEEAKLIRCTRGAIFDVVLDLRAESPSFKKWYGIELTESNHKMLYVPQGCAHGYQTLVDDTEVFYPVSEFYSPEQERGIRWNDPEFMIAWPLVENVLISAKDDSWPDFKS